MSAQLSVPATLQLDETYFRLYRGTPVLFPVIRDTAVDSEQTEDQLHVLHVEGDNATRFNVLRCIEEPGVRTLELRGTPRISLRLPEGNPFEAVPSFSMGTHRPVQLFRADPSTIRLSANGVGLVYSSVSVDVMTGLRLKLVIDAAAGPFRPESIITVDDYSPGVITQLLDKVAEGCLPFLRSISQEQSADDPRPVPSFLAFNLRDILFYYGERKQRSMTKPELTQLGHMMLVSAQAVTRSWGADMSSLHLLPEVRVDTA